VVPTLSAALAQLLGGAAIGRETIRTRPASNAPAGDDMAALYNAYEKAVKDNGKEPTPIELRSRTPEDTFKSKYEAYTNPDTYAASGRLDGGDYYINNNPNMDRAMLGHELGHIAAQHTPAGEFIANLRHSPALSNAYAKAALLTLPAGAFAALTPGDDDIDEAMVLATLASSPIILDEINATRHGLDIMNRAGLQATIGQRAKLAGGLLSYAAVPLTVGGAAALTGNIFDQPIPN